MLLVEPWRRRAAGDERLELLPVAHAAAVDRGLDEVTEGRDTELHLVHARLVDVSRDGEHAHALAALRAELGERLASVAHDPRQVCERLDVVHDRGLLVQPDRGWEVRRLEARHAAISLEALDEPRLLADDVGARTPRQ